jgi:hypothetical protein
MDADSLEELGLALATAGSLSGAWAGAAFGLRCGADRPSGP